MELMINTIDDVLPQINTDNGICVSKRTNYTVIDYVFVTKETFDTDMALQCRGLKFDLDGRIIGRPFHKFFNMYEKEDPSSVDWSRPHTILEKLDGTMIHPVMLGSEMVFMTRMGITSHAERAMALASPQVVALCRDLLAAGLTPMFEYTGPENRVVVLYESSRLTLLAVRETITGRYLPYAELARIATKHDVPVAQSHGTIENIAEFIADGRALRDVEGYVIAFDDGHRVKLKADGYVLRHRALSHVHLEKNVLNWVLTGAVDDVIPLLSPKAAERVLEYQSLVEEAISQQTAKVQNFYEDNRCLDRKDYALAAAQTLPKHLRSAAFIALDGRSARDGVHGHLAWAAHSQPRIDQVREFYGLEWSGDDLVLQDEG
ncbi:MAG: RNA ligase [Filomicrobium sp.]